MSDRNELTFSEKYQAIGTGGSTYEGMFITCVTTTGIFCRPSCRAKKPKASNILFFETVLQALQNGFRPCKMCKPMELQGATPEDIQNVLSDLVANPFLRIRDYDLRKRGIAPSMIRRWFKKNHKMTFHCYQRLLRINKAYNDIKRGNSVTGSAFGVGYESLSAFSDGYKSIFGNSPKKGKPGTVINVIRFTTQLGPMYACATETGICLLEFTDRRMIETEFKDLCRLLGAVILPGKNHFLDKVQTEVREYLSGQRTTFTVPLHTPGTEFQKKVWGMLCSIPYGSTVSYLQQARQMGLSSSVRAVASANGYNRVALMIPCHRVIASNGDLSGYGGGLARKKWLIDMEGGRLQN